MPTYKRTYNGRGVVADFRRLLETGNMAKLTPRLYQCLTLSGGFIAHYDLHGFRATFDGRLTELLAGEMQPLTDPDRFDWPALKDSVYFDGMTAGDVMRAICEVGRELERVVVERESAQRAESEIGTARLLAERHGLRVVA